MAATSPTPRARGRLLLRGQGIGAPLFVPLLHAVAAQIESVPPRDFVHDAGRLARGLAALRDAVPTDALVVCCAAAMEAEAAGAELDWDVYPPRVTKPAPLDVSIAARSASPRIAAALESTRRLHATARGEPLLVAALTGPATLSRELSGEAQPSAAAVERAGAIGVELAGQFCRAGASAIVLLEENAPQDDEARLALWRSVLAPIVKVARFHQAIAVIVCAKPAIEARLGLEGEGGAAVIAFPESVSAWPTELPVASVITTVREVPPATQVAELRAACGRVHVPG